VQIRDRAAALAPFIAAENQCRQVRQQRCLDEADALGRDASLRPGYTGRGIG
jgi:hypothetical protein